MKPVPGITPEKRREVRRRKLSIVFIPSLQNQQGFTFNLIYLTKHGQQVTMLYNKIILIIHSPPLC